MPPEAFRTSRSRPPKVSTAVCMSWRTLSGSVRSAPTAMAFPPAASISATTLFARGAFWR